MAATRQVPPGFVEDVLAEVNAYLTNIKNLMLVLQGDPTDADIERALNALEEIRDFLEGGHQVGGEALNIRNRIGAQIYRARPGMTGKRIADAMGVNDSMLSRIVQEEGIAPRRRVRKPPKPSTGDADPPTGDTTGRR